MKTLFPIVILMIFNNIVSLGQEKFKEKKFRDVSYGELKMKACDFYPGADAMVLFNVGDIYISYEPSKGLIYKLSVHKRIKIFTKLGKNYAKDKIKFYKSRVKRLSDDIRGFRAYTYNLVNGKIEETKLKNKDKYINELSDYQMELSFAMPNVQEGSVIDIKYELISTHIGALNTWYFQDVVPVKYSKYSYLFPEFLEYNIISYGDSYSIESKEKNNTLVISNNGYDAYGKTIIMKDILPLEKENFMSSILGNLSRLEFNLVYVDKKYQKDDDFGGTYDKMNEKLLDDDDFGYNLKKGKFAKIWKDELKRKSQLEKVEIILKKLQKNIAWDKNYSIFSNKPGRSILKKQEGDIGDINWTLIQALKYYDIETYPVIVKLKKYGIPNPYYSNIFEFDYLLALAVVDGKEYLCDASLDIPLGMIRAETINDKGFLVDKNFRWVDLTKDARYTEGAMIQTKLEDGFVYYTVNMQLKDYAALEAYKKKENNKFKDEIKKMYPDYEIMNIKLNENNNRKVFKYTIELRKEPDDENLIIIDPLLKNGFIDNPFKREKRISNIDFEHKIIHNFAFSLTIPEGYTVEMPANSQVKNEDGSLLYRYMAVKAGNKLSVIMKFQSKKTTFTPKDYKTIKTFFETMTSSNKQVLLLKKEN